MEEQAEKFRTQKSNNNLLIVASARGYLADVEALIERGAELGCRDRHSMTPLHYAAAGGRLSVVEALLSRGAEVDPEAPDGRTPLHLAALRGHSDTIRTLARSGAWLGAFDGADCTPLHLAARHGRLEAVETLLSLGADPSARNRYGLRPVDEASVAGQLDAATALQRAGGGASDARSMPELLPFAAGLGRLVGVRSLLADGADVDGSAPDGTTALHAAALAADPDVTALLLESGANPSKHDAGGQTPVDVARRAQRDAEEARQRSEREPPPLRKPWPPVPAPVPATSSEKVILLLDAAEDVVGKKGQRRTSTESSVKEATTENKLPASLADLDPRERLRKIERWATMRRNGKNDDLDSALRDLLPEVRTEVESRLASIAEVDAHLNIHKAVRAFHADVDFQADAARSEVQEAINEIQADPSAYEARIADPLIAGVFGKLRQVHAVCTANGQRKVELAMLLVEQGKEDEIRKNDALILARMEAARQAHVAAAAAAGTNSNDDPAAAAAAMYEAVVDGADQAVKDQEKEERNRSGLAERSAEIREVEDDDTNIAAVHPTAAKSSSAQKKRVRFAQESEEAEILVEEEEDPLDARTARLADPPREADQAYEDLPEWMNGPFSWAKVWDEFKRQCKQALMLLLVMLVILTLLRRELPWVSNRAPRSGSVQEGAGHQEL